MWVNLTMALRVMVLNMLKLRRVLERGIIPVEMSHPLMEIGITTPNIADIALEMLYVDRIEAHDSGIQADISFSDVR
jgi:hypothetical protein